MSQSNKYPFLALEMKLPDGSILPLGSNLLVIDGGKVLLGRLAFIDTSSISPQSSMPTMDVAIDDVISHKLNAGIPPNINRQRAGMRYVDDPHPTGVRCCRVSQADYEKLKAWHDRHGATGGTDDDSQAPNPGDISFPPWTPGPGKEGGTGGGETDQPVVTEHPGKDTGGGEITGAPDDRTEFHPADTNKDGLIDREEKKAWNKKNPDNPVEKT